MDQSYYPCKGSPMGLLDLGFEWPVDDGGCEIAPAEEPPPYSGGSWLLHEGKPERIVWKGGRVRWARPLEFNPMLYLHFALLDGRPETCAEFASRFGLLGLRLGLGQARDRKELLAELGDKSISEWRTAIKGMLHAVGLWETNPQYLIYGRHQFHVTRLDAVLVPAPPDGKLALRIRPRSLLGAMYLQFGQAVSSGLDIKTCEQCGKLFESGGTQRRRDARFCSDSFAASPTANERKRS